MVLPGLVSPPGFFTAPEANLITQNLKVQFEMDNSTAPTATSWVDEIAGINLTVQASMTTPSIVSGGTPTGEDYYQFTDNDGLGTILLSGEDIPAGADSRSLYVVCRYSSILSAVFHGVVYGDSSTNDEAFGLVLNDGNTAISVDLFLTLYNSTSEVADDTFHVLLASYDDSENLTILRDNVFGFNSNIGTIDTVLQKLFINELIDNTPGASIDVAAILIYDGAHNASDREQTFLYLKNKYIGA